MLELASCAAWLRRVEPIPDHIEVEDFHRLHHGASYMAREEQVQAFDFLLGSSNRVSLTSISAKSPASPGDDCRQALSKILSQLKAMGHSVYAADLSSDEALRVGMRVVRVVIPSLMPFSWVQRARFLGHPRLYAAPKAMGYDVRGENEINPMPQPFG